MMQTPLRFNVFIKFLTGGSIRGAQRSKVRDYQRAPSDSHVSSVDIHHCLCDL